MPATARPRSNAPPSGPPDTLGGLVLESAPEPTASEFEPAAYHDPQLLEWIHDVVAEDREAIRQADYAGVVHICKPALIDAETAADQYHNARYEFGSVVGAWVYRLIAPSKGYSVMSWRQLADALENRVVAKKLGFTPGQTPSARTLREQYSNRVDDDFRDQLRYEAARKAIHAQELGFDTAENVRENLIVECQPDDEESDPIGEIEQELKDEAYEFQADLIRDLCSYDRDGSTEYDEDLITDAASHMCRLNEYAEQGIDRMADEYGLEDVFSQQTFRRTVRNVERTKIPNSDRRDGARWLPPHELVDPKLVRGDLREALEEAWTIDPHDPDGETSLWHRRTEEGIAKQIQWLRDEGVIDEDDSFDLRIDYTTHNYSKHSSTDSPVPIGVHNRRHLDTGYAWKELQATIQINGRSFLIASVNYLPTNDQFQCVRYLIERAQELVNVDTILADAEFSTVGIARFADHRGCDYAIRKGATTSVKQAVDEQVWGEAGWIDDWTMITDGRFDQLDTTLVALEKNFKSRPDPDSSDEDEEPTTTLEAFTEDDDGETDDSQLTFKEIAERADEPEDKDFEYFCIITNRPVEKVGINPAENPIAHDDSKTAWGVGSKYRDRWAVETQFRDRKHKFQAQTTSRDLGYRRYLWMMANLIYNGWVMLNTHVAEGSPAREGDEIVVKQNSYLDELDRRVLSEFGDFEFPDREFG